MESFEYQSLNKHLEQCGKFLSSIAGHIAWTAMNSVVDGEFDIAVEDIPYDFDFLEDRELIAEMLAERPEVAFIEAHNNGFNLRLEPLRQEIKPLTQDDLDIIHARHMLWSHDQPGGEKADFTGQELRDLCFMRMRFSYASFAGATLENCCLDEGRFFGCDFGDATMVNCTALGGAEFVGAKFANAAITGCSFEKAWCMDASFPGTWIERCDFTGAVLDGADFSQAELVECEGLEGLSQDPAMKMGG